MNVDKNEICSIFYENEGEGLSGQLMRCKLCHKGWTIGSSFSSGPKHFPNCLVEKLEIALTKETNLTIS